MSSMSSRSSMCFCDIAEKVRSKIPPTKASCRDYLKERQRGSFFFRPTDKEEVKKLIRSLDHSKSTGPKSIPFKIHKCVNDEIASNFIQNF